MKKPAIKRYSLAISADIHRRLHKYADKKGIKIAFATEEALKLFLAHQEHKEIKIQP